MGKSVKCPSLENPYAMVLIICSVQISLYEKLIFATMNKEIIAFSVIIILLLISVTSASHSEEFIDQVTDMICNDCQGKDIHLNQPITYTSNDGSTKSFDNLTWEYRESDISWQKIPNNVKFVVNAFNNANFSYIDGTCDDKSIVTPGIDGCNILRCGNHHLDINGDTFYWDNQMIDFLKKEEMYNIVSGSNNTQVNNKGDKSAISIGNNNIANTGDNCTITQQDIDISFNKGFAYGAIITFLLETAIILIQRWQKKKGPAS
jgi:hypothetical protein